MGSPPEVEATSSSINRFDDLNTNIEHKRTRRWFIRVLGCGCLVFWLFCIYTYRLDSPLPIYIPGFFAGLTTLWLVFTHIIKGSGFILWSSRLFTLSLMALMSYYMILGGENNTRALWSNIFPLIAIFMLGRIEGGIWSGLFWVFHLLIVLEPSLPLIGEPYDFGFSLRYFLSLSLAIFMTYSFETGRLKVQKTLHHNQQLLRSSEEKLRHAFEELKTAQSQLVQSGKLWYNRANWPPSERPF